MAPQQRVLKPEVVERIAKGLIGTNFKLVPVGDSGSGAGARAEPSNEVTPDQPSPDQDYYPFPIKYVERPPGTPGKAPPRGFHTGDVLGLTRSAYALLMEIVDTTLKETPGIDMRRTITNQKTKSAVTDAKLKLVARIPVFRVYEDDGYWPLDCLIFAALKSSKDKLNRRDKQARLDQAQVQQADQDMQNEALAKKRELAQARGQASAKARAQARAQAHAEVEVEVEVKVDVPDAGAPVQMDTESEAEAQTETNKGDRDASELQVSNGADDAVEVIVQEISSMSLCISTDDTVMAEEDVGGPMLPPDLVQPSPSARVSATTSLVTPEAPPPTTDTALPPASSGPNFDAMQDKLARLKALPLTDRAQLPPGLQLLLSVLDTNSELPNLQLLAALLHAAPDTTTPTSVSSSTPPAPVASPASAPEHRPLLSVAPTHSNIATHGSTSAPVPCPKELPKPRMRPSPPPPLSLPEPGAAYTPTLATKNAPTLTDSTAALGSSITA
ncbi:hypothetical protein FRC11_000232, partial [Ceratobasidium sp. 423]